MDRSRGPETTTPPGEYPAELEREVVLRSGERVRVRPIRVEDAPRLVAMHARFSQHTAYQRFFTVLRRLPPDWAKVLATVDYRRRLALVAERDTPEGPQVLGVGRWEPTDREDTAEVAFVVEDAWQGKGLGTLLLLDLLRAAEARGLRRFCAYVLADNARMLALFARFTDIERRRVETGVVEIVFTPRRARAAAARA